jgi:hypothetical protein
MDLPLGKKPIIIKWVYKVNIHDDGTTEKLKAQLVARGFQQQVGEDFEETYALVAKYNTL